jgi:hypothetical protein
MDKSITTIWWASKELVDEEPLSKFIGKNEKTTIVVKFSKVFPSSLSPPLLPPSLPPITYSPQKGQGAPPREAHIDAESRNAMMAYYHRKQEEHKVIILFRKWKIRKFGNC